MDLFAFDIETDTSTNGLDPRVAEITSIALWAATTHEVIIGGTEVERLERFFTLLDELPPSIGITWNGAVFDGPFIESRTRTLGLNSGFALMRDVAIEPKYEFLPDHQSGYRMVLRGHRHADVAYAYRDFALGDSDLGRKGWSLKPVCKALGIEMVEVDRTRVHLLSESEERDYVLSDAHGTYLLAERLGEGLSRWVDRIPGFEPAP